MRMMNELGDNAMYVERLFPAAREKLVTIADGAPLTEAANFLHKGTALVIVCDSAGLVAGVITKTDVVGQMSRCQGASSTMAASLAMTRDVVVCRPGGLLQDLRKRKKERKLKNIPVVDKDSRPVGVLHSASNEITRFSNAITRTRSCTNSAFVSSGTSDCASSENWPSWDCRVPRRPRCPTLKVPFGAVAKRLTNLVLHQT
jgi:CBS domain-containing protein